ncbi:hypothetical protein ABH937_004139 [Kitasatospora sp. GAS1066B]
MLELPGRDAGLVRAPLTYPHRARYGTAVSNSTPPGWYPDPEPAPGTEGAHERFWDGSGWTARSRPLAAAVAATLGAVGQAPAPQPSAPPSVPPPFGRLVAAGPSEPAMSLSDASPAYGHPAIPEPESPVGYGIPAAALAPPPMTPPPPVPVPVPAAGPVPQAPPLSPHAYPLPAYPTAGPLPYPSAPPVPPAASAPVKRTGLVLGLLTGALALIVVVAGVSISLVRGSTQTAGRPGVAAPGLPQPQPRPGAGAPTGSAAPAPGSSPAPAPGSSAGSGSSPGSAPQSKSPLSPDGGSVQDAVHNWSVPLLAGWDSADHDASTAALLVTGPYQCATPGGCVRGNFTIDSNPAPGPDAETVARQTMAGYAPQLFGPLGTHQELTSGPISVAGLTGFAVRWHVVPQQAGPGFLLLIALPAPGGGFTTLVGSVDDDPQAPAPAVLDQIAAGIRAADLPPGGPATPSAAPTTSSAALPRNAT